MASFALDLFARGLSGLVEEPSRTSQWSPTLSSKRADDDRGSIMHYLLSHAARPLLAYNTNNEQYR